MPFKWKKHIKQKENAFFFLTNKENDENYDHGEKNLVPEPRHPVPDAQVENTLPSVNNKHLKPLKQGTRYRWPHITGLHFFLLTHSTEQNTRRLPVTFWQRWRANRGWQWRPSPHRGRVQQQSTAKSSWSSENKTLFCLNTL